MNLCSIEEKITWAKARFSSCKRELISDAELAALLKVFKRARELSHQEMRRAGITRICHRCEVEDGGSCCGAGIEDHYDQWLLLTNLLLGVRLPKARWKDDSCFFLGSNGCMLMARHAICVNYLCKEISKQVDPLQVALMREKEGEELESLFFVCERIKKVIRDCGRGNEKKP